MCGYEVRYYSSMLVHMRSHTKEKPFACALCPFASSQLSNLRKHEATHGLAGSRQPSGRATAKAAMAKVELALHLSPKKVRGPETAPQDEGSLIMVSNRFVVGLVAVCRCWRGTAGPAAVGVQCVTCGLWPFP